MHDHATIWASDVMTKTVALLRLLALIRRHTRLLSVAPMVLVTPRNVLQLLMFLASGCEGASQQHAAWGGQGL